MRMPRIRFHYSLLFLILLSLYSGGLKTILLILGIIFLHELAHFTFIKLFKGDTHLIEISIVGGMMYSNRDNLTFIQKIIVDISGVFINLCLVFIFFDYEFIRNYNIIMIIFNLFPILPLDGYNLVNDCLSQVYEEEFSLYIIKIVSFIMLIILFFLIIYFKYYQFVLVYIYLIYRYLLMYKNSYASINRFAELYKKC